MNFLRFSYNGSFTVNVVFSVLLYTDTYEIQKRLQQHQNGIGCTYTKTRTPVELVYTEELPDKLSALKREKQIKKLQSSIKKNLLKKVG